MSSAFQRVQQQKRKSNALESSSSSSSSSSSASGLKLMPLELNRCGRLCGNLRSDISFGVLGIDSKKLEKNIISIIRLRTRKKVDLLPNHHISNEFRLVLDQLIQGVFPQEAFDELSREEQEYLNRMIKVSHIKLEQPEPKITEQSTSTLQNRLLICVGEMDSYNNSKDLKLQTKLILSELYHRGELSSAEKTHIMTKYKL
jgi:hypothetical protein